MHETELTIPAPYYPQFEDVDHLAAYVSGERSLDTDPFWARSGASSPQEYAYWANRACGMVCVKTCIEAFGGIVKPLHHWIQQGLVEKAYLTEKRSNDTLVEKGWLHAGLATVMMNAELAARVQAAKLPEVVSALEAGNLVIASVSYEIGTDLPVTHKGGHLVTIVGARVSAGEPTAVIIHNPSGRTPALRENAPIPVGRFQEAFSNRVIIVGKQPERL